MNASKLTIATIFLFSMTWAGVAHAEEPCGSGMVIDNFKSCEVIEEPECYEVCKPDATLVACVAEQSASCTAKCDNGKSVECETTCEQKCEGGCTAQGIEEEPPTCEEKCEAKCGPSCADYCKHKKNKVECAAMCPSTCSDACEEACGGGHDDDDDDGHDGHDDYGDDDECTLSCEQSCYGSCAADEARDCELECQLESMIECKAKMTETCTEWCDDGAVLVCDESFVNPDDINSCLGALDQAGVPIKGPREAFRSGNNPEVATAGNCSVQDQAKLGLAGAFFTFAGFGLAAGFLRRRRRS